MFLAVLFKLVIKSTQPVSHALAATKQERSVIMRSAEDCASIHSNHRREEKLHFRHKISKNKLDAFQLCFVFLDPLHDKVMSDLMFWCSTDVYVRGKMYGKITWPMSIYLTLGVEIERTMSIIFFLDFPVIRGRMLLYIFTSAPTGR